MPSVTLSRLPTMDRSWLDTEDGIYPVPLTLFRTWDALATNLPATAAADDLALITGTLGTHGPNITAGDVKTLSGTRYARCQIPVPVEYTAASTLKLRAKAGMQTTVAGTSCDIDFQVYRIARDTTVGADICSTAATTINSLVFADKEFTITPTTLAPGDLLDVRLALIYVDAATGTAVTPTMAALELVCSIRG